MNLKILFVFLIFIDISVILKAQNCNCSQVKVELLNCFEVINNNIEKAKDCLDSSYFKIVKCKCDSLLPKYYYENSVYLFKIGKMEEAIPFLNKSDSGFQLSKDYYNLGVIANFRGILSKEVGNYDEALKYYSLSKDYYVTAKDSDGIYLSILNKASTYSVIGKVDLALENYFTTLAYYENINNLKRQSDILLHIGHLYQKVNDIPNALKYASRSIAIREITSDSVNLALSLIHKALIYIQTDSFDKMKPLLTKAEAIICNKNYARLHDNLYTAYGKYYTLSKKYDIAEEYYKKAMQISLKIGSEIEVANDKNSLAELYILNNKCKEAISLFLEIIPIVKEDFEFSISANYALSEAYICMGDYKNAYYSIIESHKIQDTFLRKEKINALQELETKYETEKKECIITQQNLEIKNKNMGLGLIGGGLLGAIGLSTLLYRKRSQEQELNQLLDQQNRVLQDANQGLLHQLSIQRESDEVAQEPLMITLSNGSQSTVNIDEIQYFEAENNIVKIVLADGTVRHDYQRLKNFTELLKDSAMFIQIHRSYLVNVNHVTSHKANDLKMRSGDTLPIGITMKEKVHAKLKEKGV